LDRGIEGDDADAAPPFKQDLANYPEMRDLLDAAARAV
jgi:hypothetical protein